MVPDALLELAEPRFFFDGDVEPQVRQLITEAKEYIVLVSPYSDFWLNLKDALRDARKRGVAIRLVYRKGEDGKDIKWLRAEGAEVLPVERLHSKLYANETTALVTSMNLVASSTINSKELCARFDGSAHGELLGYVNKLTSNGDSAKTSDIKIRLRDYRSREAKERNVPAFTIFTDNVIELISSKKPKSLNELETIKGVGPAILKTHGAAILKIINGTVVE